MEEASFVVGIVGLVISAIGLAFSVLTFVFAEINGKRTSFSKYCWLYSGPRCTNVINKLNKGSLTGKTLSTMSDQDKKEYDSFFDILQGLIKSDSKEFKKYFEVDQKIILGSESAKRIMCRDDVHRKRFRVLNRFIEKERRSAKRDEESQSE